MYPMYHIVLCKKYTYVSILVRCANPFMTNQKIEGTTQ